MKKWCQNSIPALNSKTNRGVDEERQEVVGTEDYQTKKRSEAIVQIFKGEDFGLPEGWLVEQRTRTNPKYFGKIDQLFYQVGSKHKFRSMKSVNNYLDETQSLNKNEQPPPRTKNQQRPYDDRPESEQLRDIIIHDAIPISVYFPPDCKMINLTAPFFNKIYSFPTGPSSDVKKTSPPPIPQSPRNIPLYRGFDIDLNRIPFTIDLNSIPFTEPHQEDMNTTGTQIPFSHTPTSAPSKQKMKAPSLPIFYDTEFNCLTSNIDTKQKMKASSSFEHTPAEAMGPNFYDTEFNSWTSNVGHSIQDYKKKY